MRLHVSMAIGLIAGLVLGGAAAVTKSPLLLSVLTAATVLGAAEGDKLE